MLHLQILLLRCVGLLQLGQLGLHPHLVEVNRQLCGFLDFRLQDSVEAYDNSPSNVYITLHIIRTSLPSVFTMKFAMCSATSRRGIVPEKSSPA